MESEQTCHSSTKDLCFIDVSVEALNFVGRPKLLLALFGNLLQLLPFFVKVVDLHLNLFGRFRLADGQELLRDHVQLLQTSFIGLQVLKDKW